MSQHDGQLPDDLRDISARLSAARFQPTGTDLDQLQDRIQERVARTAGPRRRRRSTWSRPMRLAAGALTTGLALSSGAGIVLATESFGSHGDRDGSWSWPSPPKIASACQYRLPWTYTRDWQTSHGFLKVLWVWDCKRLWIHIECSGGFGYKWFNGGWNDIDLTSYTLTDPGSGTPLSIDTDGTTFNFAISGSTVTATSTQDPSYTVTFNANGGGGTMARETANEPTALTPDAFTRTGYAFTGWNTAANGSGTAYANDATYPFSANVTLYAQWKATHTVTFNANGGVGAMASETASGPTALATDTFTRAGYTFTGWNTAANGGGMAYANGATYPFSASVTLYAQWSRQARG